jgi:hypothetical protein
VVKALAGIILISAVAACGPAFAEDGLCPGTTVAAPVIAPVISSSMPNQQSDAAYDCMMWQSFIYLNWPVLSGQRGNADHAQAFGTPHRVVWESYKTVEDVFLPKGTDPGPWDENEDTTGGGSDFSESVKLLARGAVVRVLSQVAKVSGAVANPDNPNSPNATAKPHKRTLLDDANQTDGGNLIDQNGQYVFYEMLMNRDEYDYIIRNNLYEATQQGQFAQQNGIEMPTGATSYGRIGAIEVKAAWKVLGPGDDPARFHTARALVGKDREPATIGLVGLHIIQHASPTREPVWATFAQIDNAPAFGAAERRHYSFFNADCPPTQCSVDTTTDAPTPTQVVQIRPVAPEVARVNAFMQALIKQAAPNAPWQYYQLIGVQWSRKPVDLPPPPRPAPLPAGSPNVNTLLNPALETFLQTFRQPIGCLSCHVMARLAESQTPPYAADYSFLLSHARMAHEPQ